MNRESQIADRVARSVISGLIQPPPAMVDEIHRWARAKEGANDAWAARNSLLFMKESVEEWEKAITEKVGGPDNLAYLQEMLESSRENLKDTEEFLQKSFDDMKLYPSVKIGKWKRAKKKFKVNTRGWRYKSLIDKADPDDVEEADALLDAVTVELTHGDLRGNAKAYWRGDISTLRISMGGALEGVIRHELVHWAQAYLRIALRAKGFGKPSRKIRTPEYSQHMNIPKELRREMKQMGLKDTDIHDLDDVEFYTELADSYAVFNMMMKRPELKRVPRLEVFRKFVGQNGEPLNSFFKTLKNGSYGKWKKAVKELAKAAL